MKQKITLLIISSCLVHCNISIAMSPEARAKGFVYLHQIDPTIIASLRYCTSENFVSAPVEGYKKPVVMMTEQAAQALKKVQEEVKKDGYSLVVYDAYRPQRAVNHFMQWADEVKDQAKKSQYYPRIDKEKVFELGYVDKKSGHSRGSTVDLTLKKDNEPLHEIRKKERILTDGFKILFLDDGTLDMGSSFDLFDTASHYTNDLIDPVCKERRAYLKNVMEKHGFKGWRDEWWHFTLKNEPYPADKDESYFDFPIE